MCGTETLFMGWLKSLGPQRRGYSPPKSNPRRLLFIKYKNLFWASYTRVKKKMKFKACEFRKTAAYYGVCEDFEYKCNTEITLLEDFLRSETAAALERNSLAGDVGSIVGCEEDADTTDVLLGVGETTQWNTLNGLLEEVGIVLLPLLEALGHSQWADNIHAHSVGTPLGSCHA